MKRSIDYYLNQWKQNPYRTPLLLRGARQVGKTHSARTLGKSFDSMLEINLELRPDLHIVFENDLQPERILQELSLLTKTSIVPGKILLFFDEIQACPKAIAALRYFYELIPELHVIAAGSLLDFAIEELGLPVGRIQSLHMYPLSFFEFLAALGEELLLKELVEKADMEPISTAIHEKLLLLLGQYLAIGGMPRTVQLFLETSDPLIFTRSHQTIVTAYRQDFGKYAKKSQVKYVDLLFDQIPRQLGGKFKFSLVEGEFRKRELSPALDLLITAGVATKVFRTSAAGIPIGAQIDPQDYKVIFMDCALAETIIGADLALWFVNPLIEFINKGVLIESFVGQELLAYSDPYKREGLFYWHRYSKASTAEIDYLIQFGNTIIPIEVKSGMGRTLKSLNLFLEEYTHIPYGVRFSTHNYSTHLKLHSYPLYAVGVLCIKKNQELASAVRVLYSR